jgi:hypothetical protein
MHDLRPRYVQARYVSVWVARLDAPPNGRGLGGVTPYVPNFTLP